MANQTLVKITAFILPIAAYAMLHRLKRGALMLGISFAIVALPVILAPEIAVIENAGGITALVIILPYAAIVLWQAYQIADIFSIARNSQSQHATA